ncbi:MAG: T9SS type A sorting domain-containing protein [Bacteroidia bacterium]
MKNFQLFPAIATLGAFLLFGGDLNAQDTTQMFANPGTGTTQFQLTNAQSASGGFQLGIEGNNNIFFNQLESQSILFRTGSQERLRISAAGNVGIGTSNPLTPLHVDGRTRFGGRIVVDEGDGIYFENPTQSLIIRTAPGNMAINAHDGSLDFGTRNLTKIRITGTYHEIRMVDGSTSMGTNFGLQAISPNDTLIPFGIKAHAGQKAPLMVIQNGGEGRVWTVDHDGSQAIKRSFLKGYALTVGGDIMAHTYSSYADQRMQQQPAPLNNVMQNLRSINGISFNYKGAPFDKYLFPAKRQFGLRTQEVRTVYPELITMNADSFYSISYHGFIPVLIEGMKELDSVQTKFETKIQEQEDQYKVVLSEIDVLKMLVDSLKIIIENHTGVMAPGGDDFDKPILYQNQPNPFTVSTAIKYYLPYSVNSADLYIYDMSGKQLIRKSISQRGSGAEIIDGNELQAGMYIYSLIADNKEIANKRMILTN